MSQILDPQLVLLLIIIGMAVFYITRWIPPEATSLLVIFALIATNILPAEEAFSGFSSTATITVASMFVLSAGLLRTGALDIISIYIVRFAGKSVRRVILLMAFFIPVTSAFINNTPVVVMMVPILLSACRRLELQPSKLMIPLSYLAILGGTMTLLGTSTNILVDDLYRKAGGPGFGLFEFLPLGLIFTVVGTVYLVFFGRNILPLRAPLASLITNRRHTPYITELLVTPDCLLLGQSITEAFSQVSSLADGPNRSAFTSKPRHKGRGQPQRRQLTRRTLKPAPDSRKQELELLAVYRNEQSFLAEDIFGLTFQEGDLLLVAGTAEQSTQFTNRHRLALATVLEDNERVPVVDPLQRVVEAVVLPDSPLHGVLLASAEFNRRYQIKVMGLQRFGQQLSSGLRTMRLQSGHVLLMQGDPEQLSKAAEENKLMLIHGVDSSIPRVHKNRVSLFIMFAVILAAAISPLPISGLAVAGAALLLITHSLNISEAIAALNVDTLLLLAATIPLGVAMNSTGMAETIVDGILLFSRTAHPLIFLSVFYLFTNLITQLLSNNAVAVLLTPICLTLSTQLGIDAKPLLMAVAFGASSSFMTPMGYQTNAIVMGAGGYRFGDYLRVGAPLTIITWLLATIFIPIFWPL